MMEYLEHHSLDIVFSIFIEVCDRYPIVFSVLQAVRTILLSKFGFGHRSNSFVVGSLGFGVRVSFCKENASFCGASLRKVFCV